MKYLTQTQKDEILELIRLVESRSSAELVAVVAKQSLLFYRLYPASLRKKLLRNRAKKLFLNHRLDKTENRLGVMFFVSIAERQVEIVADIGIGTKISDAFWQDIANEFIEFVKRDEFGAGLKYAISKSLAMLTQKFPISDSDKNELSDEVVEI
ncbi:MAG: hypothetical protein GX282_02715 [Campylobacteraceae bacterium]|nr:hypothetical protein [Campylobacteraceae bacterium]